MYNDYIVPITWDGKDRMVLHKTTDYIGEIVNAEVIENYTMNTVYGRDIKAVKNMDGSDINSKVKDFDLTLYGDNKIIKKRAVFLFKTRDDNNNDIIVGEQDYPSNIDYDSKTGEITFIYRYYFEKYSSIFVAKCNVENIEKVSWEEIKLSEEVRTVGIYTPCPNNSVLIGSKYYIQSFLSLAEVDFKSKESKLLDKIVDECRSVVKEGSFEPNFPKDIIPVGVYEDILILSIPISTDVNIEYIMCAVKKDSLLGVLHIKSDGTWRVYDSNRKNVYEINLKDKNLVKRFDTDLLFFPYNGNIM